MTLQQIHLVQESFAKVEPIANHAADLFYDRLFTSAPTVRPMFPEDITAQKQKLIQVLSFAITNLNDVDKLLPALHELGRRHVEYGAKPEHYDAVGDALIWTLEQGLGDEFTPALKEAWITTYTVMADVMKSAATEREH